MIESIHLEDGDAPDLRGGRQRRTGPTESIQKLPPHSTEAEQGVLGCILLSPNDCLGECVTKLKAGAEVFYDLRHQELYSTLLEMYDAREGIDIITIQSRLSDQKKLESVGGLAYLASLPDAVPSAAGLDYYIDIVVEKYRLRKLAQTCTAIVGRVYDDPGEVEELMDAAERDILAISADSAVDTLHLAKPLVHGAIATLEEWWRNKGVLTGIGTGFIDFDKMTTGMHGGEMLVIAARPSQGKTSLAMNIVENVAVDQQVPVGVFSLEMTAEQLMLRMVCSRARVNARSIQDGFLAERDFPKLTNAAGKLSSAPLFIDDSSGLSILQLKAKARRMHQQYGIKLFVIDYLQLLNSTNKRADNRQLEVSDISAGIKALSKELNVPIVVLSQLNRELEKRSGERPRLSDIRESGSIENDADLVGLLYRERKGDEDEAESDSDAIPINLLIAKQRNGPCGDVHLTFLKSYTRFESAAKVGMDDVPEYEAGGRRERE